ncbi:DNA polymerase III delta subunit [hydrothermal vent metagenome]|uniref:DNA polymerase III subunit delta n=1 Tax=hydrothermal vent metagenome TaxID=652676 RepID=A0A3B0W189_9ZZZZ
MILASAFLNQLQDTNFQPKPVYLLYGEEPLFLRDSYDGLRKTLKAQGYLTGDVYDVDASFDWQGLQMETQAGSLFAEQRMILVNMPKGSPGRGGGEFIQNWCQYAESLPPHLPPELVIVIQCERLDSRQIKSKWVKAIESVGCVVQAKPVPMNALPNWCQQKAQSMGLQLEREAAALLAERVEGNLLAADQELIKLSLVLGEGAVVSTQVILEQVVDQAHYQLFALSTAVLNGKVHYSLQMLNRLREEGIEAPVLLWLLSKELRQLIELSQLSQQISMGQAFKQCRIWSSRQSEFACALNRKNLAGWQRLLTLALKIDLMIKGISPTLSGDEVWLEMSQLVLKMAQESSHHQE